MTFLIVGASAGLGRALTERFAADKHPLAIVSSDLRDLRPLATDLALRHGTTLECVAIDLADAHFPMDELDRVLSSLPPLRGMLFPAAAVAVDDEAGMPAFDPEMITRVNYLSICRLVTHCMPRMLHAESRVIVGFGSVAAERGRTRNAAYSAAKRALRSYFESLRHALADRGVTVQFYTLGYLDTSLAASTRTIVPKASPRRVADIVYRRRHVDFGHAFCPGFWRVICAVVRVVPWPIFRRLRF